MKRNIVNQLYKDLGEADAINEYTEVILRKFESDVHDENSFQILAAKYGIKVNDVSLDEVFHRLRKNYIIFVHTKVEWFSDQFLELQKSSGKKYKAHEDSRSKLKSAYLNVFAINENQKQTEEYLLLLICEYYRLVRNRSAHEGK